MDSILEKGCLKADFFQWVLFIPIKTLRLKWLVSGSSSDFLCNLLLSNGLDEAKNPLSATLSFFVDGKCENLIICRFR